MKINAKDIKELRKITGAGVVDCRDALAEANGDMEKARDLLRKKGTKIAMKKLERDAEEGLIGIKYEGNLLVILEINSETDFVANNDFFQEFFNNVLNLIFDNPTIDDMDSLMKLQCPWNDNASLNDTLLHVISVIKENIKINRFHIIKHTEKQKVFYYLHNKVSNNLGKLGVALLAEINNPDADKIAIEDIGKKLCMHIASYTPLGITIDDLDENTLQKEREFYLKEAESSGKPENVIKKIVDGRIDKFFQKHVLMQQFFFFDEEKKIEEVVEKHDLKLINFIQFKISK